MSTDPETPKSAEKPRKPKTRKQKLANANSSSEYRERKRAGGIPTGRQIDTVFASVLLNRFVAGTKEKLFTDQVSKQLVQYVIKRGGWENNADVKKVVSARMKVLIEMGSAPIAA